MSGVRFHLIDSLRGLALVNMTAFHLCYDIFVVYGGDLDWPKLTGIIIWERYICFSFILISGISLNFSRRAYRHALVVNACGLLITAVTAIAVPSQAVWFGILNGIGCSMLLAQALRRVLERVNPFAGAAAALLLFAVFYRLPDRFLGFFSVPLLRLPDALYSFPPLAAVGLPADGFLSADYFPLIPWFFLFVCGFFLWRIIIRIKAERFFVKGLPALSFCGRHSLLIYMIHQPVLMGACALFFGGF